MAISPRVRNEGAGQDLGQCRLAGRVVADESQDLSGAEPEVDALQRVDTAEALVDPAHGDEPLRARPNLICRNCRLRHGDPDASVGAAAARREPPRLQRGGSTEPYWNVARNASTLSCVTIVIGTSVTRGTDPPPITVSNASTAAAPMPPGSC